MKTLTLFFAQYLPLGGSKAILLGLLCLIGLWHFTPKSVFAQNSVQHDQQAVTILNKTIAVGGGMQLLVSIQDLTETGTVTYNFAEPVSGNITVKSRGMHQFRIDADLPKGRRSTVVNGEGGSLKEEDGRNRPIHRQSATIAGGLTLPYIPLMEAMQDSSTSIIYGGLVTHNGASAYDIRLMKVYTESQDPTGVRGKREARDFYIDSNTFLVDAIADRIQYASPRDERLPHEIPHEILYSNYKSENGTMAPMTIAETIRGVTGLTMNLSQVTFNSGLADSDFAW